MLRINWYNCFRKGFMGYRVSKNWLLRAKGEEIAVKKQKETKRGPKSENQLYLSNYDSLRPKNWQMWITNWYNRFRKGFMGCRVRKNKLLGTKGAKISVK